jgi:hypothetical protein
MRQQNLEGMTMITSMMLATTLMMTPVQYIRPDLGNPYTLPQIEQQHQRQQEQQYMNDMATYQRQQNELRQQQLQLQRDRYYQSLQRK